MSQLTGKLSGVKRKHSDENQVEAKKPAMEETKRANFSALVSTNGLTKATPPTTKPATGSVKKIIIKSLKELPRLPDNYQVSCCNEVTNILTTKHLNFQDVAWQKLEEAVVAIQNSTSIKSALEDLYQAVQNLCSHNFAPLVYSKLKSLTGLTDQYYKIQTRSSNKKILFIF